MEYYLNGMRMRPISPKVADMFEEMARKQKMLVERTPARIKITATAESALWPSG